MLYSVYGKAVPLSTPYSSLILYLATISFVGYNYWWSVFYIYSTTIPSMIGCSWDNDFGGPGTFPKFSLAYRLGYPWPSSFDFSCLWVSDVQGKGLLSQPTAHTAFWEFSFHVLWHFLTIAPCHEQDGYNISQVEKFVIDIQVNFLLLNDLDLIWQIHTACSPSHNTDRSTL